MKQFTLLSSFFAGHGKRMMFFVFALNFLLLSKTQAQWADPFSYPNQTLLTNGNGVAKWITEPEHKPQWETIQAVVIDQPVNPGGLNLFAKPVSLNLDQVRNGSATSPVVPPAAAPWVNGNAGASNAHYAEGWSIPYRCVFENLPAGIHSVDIEWDTRQSGASAIDFVTNYDLLDYQPGSHVNSFGHVQETINPIVESGTWSSGTSSIIPTPSFPGGAPSDVAPYYTALMTYSNTSGPANKFSIWNGNINSMSYVSEGNVTVASSSTRLRIVFESFVVAPATTATVIIAWGGHIAKGPGVWGDNNSAAAVSGSPYHTRLISWDPDGDGLNQTSIGNQDRSLSADAVLDPPMCDLTGPSSVECSTTSTFNSGVSSSDLGAGNSFLWSITNSSSACTATITDGSHVDYATVNSGKGCGCSFTLRFTLYKNNVELSHCDKTVSVTDNTPPTITCPSDRNLACGDPTTTATLGSATATDNCSPTSAIAITFTDASVTASCSGVAGINRTWKATDACGKTSTCLQQIRFVDNTPPQMTCPDPVTVQCSSDVPAVNTSSVTTTDNCSGTVTVTHVSDAVSNSTCANRYTVTRTYRATDACGNTNTCSQTITVNDNTPPQMTCPGPVSVQCASEVPAVNTSSVTTTDNCAGTVTVTHVSDAISNSTCPNRYTVTRTYRATDACGNTNTCSQTITVNDNTAPVITSCPANVIIECNASSDPANTGSATASDNCGAVTPTYNDVSDDRGCITYIIRTWTATDACGNSATCVQNITKRDRTGPAITCTSPTTATASDNCSPVSDITLYLSNGIWTAIDGSGNITTADASTCVQGAVLRSATTQVVQEQTSQTTTVTEEKTKAPVSSRVITQNNITVQTIPNPFNDRIKFVITSPEAGNGGLDIYNMTGQKIKTVYTGKIIAGMQTFELSLPTQQVSNLVYVLRVGDKRVTGKILQMNQ